MLAAHLHAILVLLALALVAPVTAIESYLSELQERPTWLTLVPLPVQYIIMPGQCTAQLKIGDLCPVKVLGFSVDVDDAAMTEGLEVDKDWKAVTIRRHDKDGKCPDQLAFVHLKLRCWGDERKDRQRAMKETKRFMELPPAPKAMFCDDDGYIINYLKLLK